MTNSVRVRVKSVKGFCSAGYQIGDSFEFSDPNISTLKGKPICIYALSGMIPYLTAFGRTTTAADWINELVELQCPDPANTVVFSLERSK